MVLIIKRLALYNFCKFRIFILLYCFLSVINFLIVFIILQLQYLALNLFLLEKMKVSRGLRNNNPLNIRRNGTKWEGLSKEQSDNSFFCFIAPEWGYRAAIITLRNYFRVHNLKSIREWVERWAPPVENNTEAYIKCVCKRTGFSDAFEPDIYNKEQMLPIVAAMSFMENGTEAVLSQIERGWELSR